MGQSKALCEWLVEAWGHREDTPTRFCGVRFGNVLGSSGSVIPTFRRQIARGGPLTVTHPEMTRYFMTIPEAVQLVIQAGAIGGRGQIYVLDMGEPVRIVDLADTMIRLSGKEPGRDDRDRVRRSPAGREAARGALVGRRDRDAVDARGDPPRHPPSVDAAWLEAELDELERLVEAGETLELVGRLSTIVAQQQRADVLAGDGAGAAEATPASETV